MENEQFVIDLITKKVIEKDTNISSEDLTEKATSGTPFSEWRTIDGEPFLPYFWGLFDKFYEGARKPEDLTEEITLKINESEKD
jgi:hypothetical protein